MENLTTASQDSAPWLTGKFVEHPDVPNVWCSQLQSSFGFIAQAPLSAQGVSGFGGTARFDDFSPKPTCSV